MFRTRLPGMMMLNMAEHGPKINVCVNVNLDNIMARFHVDIDKSSNQLLPLFVRRQRISRQD
jgi:hypothetical protein